MVVFDVADLNIFGVKPRALRSLSGESVLLRKAGRGLHNLGLTALTQIQQPRQGGVLPKNAVLTFKSASIVGDLLLDER